jgi:zinc transport system substrate-binding protein
MNKYNLLLTVRSSLFLALILFASTSIYAKDLAFVSILPQKFIVESIAGNLLDVKVLIQPGQSPEIFDPKPKQMAELSRARLYFTIGLNFEKVILDRIIANNMQLKLIETQKGLKKSLYGGDPHIWLDPILVKQQVKTIYHALVEQFPKHQKELQQNYQLFIAKLNKLDSFLIQKLTENGSQLKNHSFVIFHPALARFSKRYHLNQIAIEQPGNKNSAKQLSDLMTELKPYSINYIIVEKQFSKKEAQTIAKVFNAQLLEVDPLAESWFNNMYAIAKQVSLSLFKKN